MQGLKSHYLVYFSFDFIHVSIEHVLADVLEVLELLQDSLLLFNLIEVSPNDDALDLEGQALEMLHASDEVEAQAAIEDQDHLLELSQGLKQLFLRAHSHEDIGEEDLNKTNLLLFDVEPNNSEALRLVKLRQVVLERNLNQR